MRYFTLVGLAALIAAPAFSDGVRNTYIAVAAQVADGILTNAKLANMANSTVKCRITSGTGVSEDCTGANINTITGVTTVGIAAVGQVPGTATNDSAAAGKVGEYQENTTSAGAQSSGTGRNATSITNLSAGDWDVQCTVVYLPDATTTVSLLLAGVSTTSATLGAFGSFGSLAYSSVGQTVQNSAGTYVASPVVRVSLSAQANVYCIAQANFGTAALTGGGFIRARRAR